MCSTTATFPAQEISLPAIARDVAGAGLMLALLQIIDGVLTGVGIAHWGTSAEGNAFIRLLMDEIGFVNALLLVKAFAVTTIFGLMILSTRVQWVGLALKGLIAVYLSFAVIPWVVLLIPRIV